MAVEVEGDADGVTHFHVPRLARDLELVTRDASFVPVRGGGDQMAVAHGPGQTIELRYRVVLPGTLESPTIVHGEDLWFLPWETQWRPTSATFDLQELERRPGLHSIGAETVQTIVPKLRRTLHVFGTHADRETEVAGCRLRVWAAPGADVDVDQAILDGQKALRALDEYWGGGLPTSYLVVFSDGRRREAVGVGNSGIARFQASLISDESRHPSGDEFGMTEVMTHEVTHHFLPWPSVAEQRWFAEGVTDYVGHVVGIRAGILPLSTYEGAFGYAAWLHEELRGATASEDAEAYERATGFLLAHSWASRHGHGAVRDWLVDARRKRADVAELVVGLKTTLSAGAIDELDRSVQRSQRLSFENTRCLQYGRERFTSASGAESDHVTLQIRRADQDCPFLQGFGRPWVD